MNVTDGFCSDLSVDIEPANIYLSKFGFTLIRWFLSFLSKIVPDYCRSVMEWSGASQRAFSMDF